MNNSNNEPRPSTSTTLSGGGGVPVSGGVNSGLTGGGGGGLGGLGGGTSLSLLGSGTTTTIPFAPTPINANTNTNLNVNSSQSVNVSMINMALSSNPIPLASGSGLSSLSGPMSSSTSSSLSMLGNVNVNSTSMSTTTGTTTTTTGTNSGGAPTNQLLNALGLTMGLNISVMSGKGHKMHKRSSYSPAILNGDVSSWQEKMGDLLCSICFETYRTPYITSCGHTFCHECILKSLDINSRCPKCGIVTQKEGLVPNCSMSDLVNVVKANMAKRLKSTYEGPFSVKKSSVRDFVASKYNDLELTDVEILLNMLQRKRELLTVESREQKVSLMIEFLKEISRVKMAAKDQLERELGQIQMDLDHSTEMIRRIERVKSSKGGGESSSSSSSSSMSKAPQIQGFNTRPLSMIEMEQKSFPGRKRRMFDHFEELSKIYLDTRNAELFDVRGNDALVPNDGYSRTEYDYDTLEEFGKTLHKISRFHSLKPLATLSYNADLLSNSNIVSSIEFDKDNEFFAIAGVTRKIKIFEYSTVIGSAVDIHCPSTELVCTAKISCISWSTYFKNNLASSDYDGCVCLWDSSTATKTRSLSEHEKRVWSVDWCHGDPRLLASGSDDAKVKLWSINTERSVGTLEAKANVCCVKFCPENTFLIAFGSADHCVHYYDFRQPREPLGVLYGHKKAVSYVKFASKHELVSASTDSHLKLWSLESMDCVRSFRGHINEKNFVGLATDGDYIACGSENNSLYIYYKDLPKPLFHFRFDNHRSMLDRPRGDDSTEFVSAVAWKRDSPVVVAANSQGSIKILELV